jgi:hypothetical protein
MMNFLLDQLHRKEVEVGLTIVEKRHKKIHQKLFGAQIIEEKKIQIEKDSKEIEVVLMMFEIDRIQNIRKGK